MWKHRDFLVKALISSYFELFYCCFFVCLQLYLLVLRHKDIFLIQDFQYHNVGIFKS